MSAPVVPQKPTPPTGSHTNPPQGRYLARLALLALGVVYGDIGTSVLYTLMEMIRETIRLKRHGADEHEVTALIEAGGRLPRRGQPVRSLPTAGRVVRPGLRREDSNSVVS